MTGLGRAEQAVERARTAVVCELNSPTEWISGEIGATDKDAAQLADALIRAVEARCAERQVVDREAARERARETARRMFAGLVPGQTGERMANEIADKILAAVYNVQEQP